MYNLAEQKLEHTNLHEIALHEDSFSLTVNTGWHCRLRAWENGALDTNCRQMWLTTVGLPAGTPTEWSLWISVRRWQTECLTYSNLQHHVAAVTAKTMSRLRSCRGGELGSTGCWCSRFSDWAKDHRCGPARPAVTTRWIFPPTEDVRNFNWTTTGQTEKVRLVREYDLM